MFNWRKKDDELELMVTRLEKRVDKLESETGVGVPLMQWSYFSTSLWGTPTSPHVDTFKYRLGRLENITIPECEHCGERQCTHDADKKDD